MSKAKERGTLAHFGHMLPGRRVAEQLRRHRCRLDGHAYSFMKVRISGRKYVIELERGRLESRMEATVGGAGCLHVLRVAAPG